MSWLSIFVVFLYQYICPLSAGTSSYLFSYRALENTRFSGLRYGEFMVTKQVVSKLNLSAKRNLSAKSTCRQNDLSAK
jgi:hypothetical protein